MQDVKMNKLVDEFLEAVQYDTNFINGVYFGTGTKVHNKLGTFRSVDQFRSYLKSLPNIFSILVLVGDGGLDDYNSFYSMPAPIGEILYFRNLKYAVDFCSIFSIKSVAIIDDIVIDYPIFFSNKSVILQSAGNPRNPRNITIKTTSKAFIVDGQSNLYIKNLSFSGGISGDIVSLIGFKPSGCANLNLYIEDCKFISSKNNIKNMDIIGLSADSNFTGFINIGLKRNDFYVTNKTNEYMINRRIPVRSCCWVISSYENKFYNESTGVEYISSDPHAKIIDPDIVQLNTLGGYYDVPSNVMTNDKLIMGLR